MLQSSRTCMKYFRDVYLPMILPVTECLDEIVDAIERSTPVVLKAPPGAGKTTGVPPALLHSGAAGDGKVLLIQPRRLAARAAASRLAKLLGVKLGQEVGYHVRFDKRMSQDTKLIAMTTGILLRRLHRDPLLEDVSCVLLDEFHERSLEVDLSLGMLHRIRTTLRPELKLVVMSATLDPQPIVDFLGDARAVTSQGRAYPVEIRHAKMVSRDLVGQRMDQQIAAILPSALKATDGHLLVFLPGIGEIRRTRRTIESMRLAPDTAIFELYGDLPPKNQDAVLAESSQRKIILATNVAETSITIPGVTGVIDSGLARVMRFDAQVGLPKLQLEPISQASAEQRAGRAGRTEAGICFRLWPAAAHRSRRERETPEIERCDFSGALLTLSAWGERDVFAFPWLTPPPAEAVDAATQLLLRLDAIDEDGSPTELGQQMLSLPLHPRLARFMVEAAKLGIADDGALAAAMLTERDPFRGEQQPGPDIAAVNSGCDITDRVDRMKAFAEGDTSAVHHVAAAKQVQRVADQIRRMVVGEVANPLLLGCPNRGSRRDLRGSGPRLGQPSNNQRLKRALLAAYPDRVAKRRTPRGDRGVMVGGRGVRLDGRSNARSGELFLCIDVDSKGTEATVRSASVIEEDWLDPHLIREVDEPFYNPSLKAVVTRRRRYFDDLLLTESPIQCRPSAEVGELLARHARLNLSDLFQENDKQIQDLIDRVRFITTQMPELELPLLDRAAIDEVLVSLCQSRTSISELRSAPWLDHLRGRYDYQQTQLIEKHAPTRMTVPSGNSIAIRYADGKPPIMQVRIQEIFGWKETPRVAGGKVAVQLHLLGPNHRPQQVTEDLSNFWNQTYAQVRKELRRRYPKHHWPEDPTIATATRNGLKPRS
jgi:ATP-dependent helicase HrpB